MLSHRYRYHEEASLATEALTLFCVMVFLMVEITLFKSWLRSNDVFYVFTVLGLLVSVAALYGHMAISLTSRLIVDTMSYGHDDFTDAPRLTSVEALEKMRDYEGALEECLIIARIYPRDPSVHLHLAENLLHLDRPEEASTWLERAVSHVESADKNLTMVNRLCEVYQRDLKQPEKAQEALRRYLKQFPESEYADSVRSRISAFGAKERVISAELSKQDEVSVEEVSEDWDDLRSTSGGGNLELEALDAQEILVAEDTPEEHEAARVQPATTLAGLDALESNQIEEDPEPPVTGSSGIGLTLDSLDATPLEELPEEEELREAPARREGLTLEAMEDAPAPEKGKRKQD